jgi:hypothetical protein
MGQAMDGMLARWLLLSLEADYKEQSVDVSFTINPLFVVFTPLSRIYI